MYVLLSVGEEFEVCEESVFYWIKFYRGHQCVILILFSSDCSIIKTENNCANKSTEQRNFLYIF
jgi:hypothetical protein